MSEPTPPDDGGNPVVMPSPTDLTTNISHIEFGDDMFVVLQVAHPVGMSVFFLDPEMAKTVAGHLQLEASRCELKSRKGPGLITPFRPGNPN